LDYFNPEFLLGMTATPERTDGYDIFKAFNYNIAYEIRLNKALEENMLCTFHYYGISDIRVNGELIDENTSFNSLVGDERVEHIIEKALFYGCDHGLQWSSIFVTP
jgi:superfamily II DNA or RNA helicase